MTNDYIKCDWAGAGNPRRCIVAECTVSPGVCRHCDAGNNPPPVIEQDATPPPPGAAIVPATGTPRKPCNCRGL